MISIFVNSLSGKGKVLSLLNSIVEELNFRNLVHEIYIDNWPDQLGDHQIWIIGGDGTLNYFINRYGCISNSISIFAGGTGNDLHWSIYGKIDIKDQIKKLLNPSILKVDVAKCNQHFFINMVGLGFDGAVLKSLRQFKWLSGHLRYLAAVLTNIFTYKEVVYEFELEDKKIIERFLLCLICNAKRTGGGFMVAPQASISDGKLNLILCEPMSIIERLLFLPKVEKGIHLSDKKLKHFEVTNLTITSERLIYYQLDGELHSSSTFNIELIKDGLNFLV
jgi:diacylglycerol kinase (ATP)